VAAYVSACLLSVPSSACLANAPQPADCELIAVKELHRFDRAPAITGGKVLFSPDGKLLISREKEAILVRESTSGKEINRIKCESQWGGLAMPAGPDYIFRVSSGKIVRNKLPSGDQEELAAYEKAFHGFVPGGKQFLRDVKGELHVCDIETGQSKRSFRVSKTSAGLGLSRFSPDGKYFANVRNVESGDIKFTVKVWKFESGELVSRLVAHTGTIDDIAYSPSNRELASAANDDTVRIWDIKSGNVIRTIKLPGGGHSVAYSPNGKWLAVGTVARRKGQISIFDPKSGEELLSWQAEIDGARQLVFHPDGKLLASAGERFIQVWELSEKKKADASKDKPTPKENR
jgi:WD40 repeat protein